MKLPRRRRLQKKTDYKARFNLLKSEKPRLVIRKTNRYLIAQIVESEIAQDKTIVRVSTKDLLTKGWPKDKSGSLKSLPACYLTGFLIGKLAQDKKIKSPILDIGMNRSIHKSRLFALLKGAVDSGLDVPHDPKALPSPEDLERSDSLKSLIKTVKEKL